MRKTKRNFNDGRFNYLEDELTTKVTSTWAGGPLYATRKEHIPGYKGHVQALKCENLHGSSYTTLTANALRDRGSSQPAVSNYSNYFGPSEVENYHGGVKTPFRRTLEISARSLLQDPKKIAPIDRIPISGYQGHLPVGLNPLRKFHKIKEDYASADGTTTLVLADLTNVKAPVVGYKGFVPGMKSQAVYGKSFKSNVEDLNTCLITKPPPKLFNV